MMAAIFETLSGEIWSRCAIRNATSARSSCANDMSNTAA